jgi:phospholipid/cholesterol/gamma-HCH transport system substrate-binding protein
MRGNVIETVMGAVVLAIAALFLVFAYKTSELRSVPGYRVSADFERVDGIHLGSDVRVSGIKVGSVVAQNLDPKTFLATLQFSVDPGIKLPDDTVAEIISAGLLGDKYISLVPGGSDKDIPADGKIKYTQSSVSLESLIGQTIFSPGGKKEGGTGSQDNNSQKQPTPQPNSGAPASK